MITYRDLKNGDIGVYVFQKRVGRIVPQWNNSGYVYFPNGQRASVSFKPEVFKTLSGIKRNLESDAAGPEL